ncbi:MAG: YhbY family RNA-binding protein [Candidatus Heimdallarchaeota archaeon]|nr:YhbY family RNA-binding protein [Candidatus Heimdallarchaeota archaeon]
MTTNLKKKLKSELSEVRNEKANVQIGKNGLTDSIFEEITKQLDHNKIIKIKFLQNFLTDDLNVDINKICSKTKAVLVEKRGRTIIIYKSSS